jgi:hypothetical protein
MEINLEIQMKNCRICLVDKPLDCFRVGNRACRTCRKDNATLRNNNFYKDYYQLHREELIRRNSELYHTKYKLERAQRKAE